MQRYGVWRYPPNFLRNSENIPNFGELAEKFSGKRHSGLLN
jgi:hypothetical protein